ncbi:aminopeptidase P family protein [Shewanella gelidii]|uniref:Xaa-Pro aminopeptidase n=1 Tax=Shewanella gelidii TaxID=1642821 RepID=A0A917N6B0_9GAMM|nr:aminopeptidase P family protein [Shewanella gelidii]MCL1096780.1 aminopeptidase P family protein [Shewanella gelidii]GGI70098.1 Xaa-Pro aminopeptidase [Shewanella gelidii]
MLQSIHERLQAVRHEMQRQNVDAFIIPRADEYLGEYVPAHNERLLWISEFTGSAGMVIVLKDGAAIFVDGRYTVQVRQQVDGQLFEYLSLVDTPQIAWLIEKLGTGTKVGYDSRLHTLAWQQHASKRLTAAGIELTALEQNPVDLSWQNRPQAPTASAMLFDESLAGQSSFDKRHAVARSVADLGADVALVTALDSICWLLNIRGQDVPCLPVILGTALLHANGDLEFFTNLDKLPADIHAHVGTGVTFANEEELTAALTALKGKSLLADPATANAWSQLLAQSAGASLIAAADPVALPKAQKNQAELTGMKACHIRDGVAVTRFLAWLDQEVEANRLYDEAELAEKLESFRKLDSKYQQPSFDTISATGANAAMCHYNHNNGIPAKMQRNSLYLVDSGAQYIDGTTDVTRTIAIGNVTAEHRKMVTLVLKGHIAVDQAKFPKGTTGQQLDAFARQYLWQYGYDYDHGTGHGVGHFLSVHEGPQRIAKNSNDVPLLPGMVVSNEPGYYRADEFGIRLENLISVKPCLELAGIEREMLMFESMTLIPMDTRLIEKSLLTQQEVDWLNQYHAEVLLQLSPFMDASELIWLKQATAAL